MRFCNRICIPESGTLALLGQAMYWPNTFEGQSVSLRHGVLLSSVVTVVLSRLYVVIRNIWNGLET